MSQSLTIIEDERLEPYFIKLVNSSYEVHQKHTPKNEGGNPYTKFVCSKDGIRQAVMAVVKRKLALKRRTKKTMRLEEYLAEVKVQTEMVESLLDDDSPERQIRLLKKENKKLLERIEHIEKDNLDIHKRLANSKMDIIESKHPITLQF